MTKQEEIDRILTRHTGCTGIHLDIVKRELSEAGVVIKGGGETTDFIKCPCDDCTAEHKLIDEWGYFCDLTCGQRSHWISRCRGRQETLNAGYVAVESLIKAELWI